MVTQKPKYQTHQLKTSKQAKSNSKSTTLGRIKLANSILASTTNPTKQQTAKSATPPK